MVQALPIKLKDLYVSKKVHHDTFIKILGDKNPLVLLRMYYIINEIEERQELFECSDDSYFIISSVSTKIALTGDAKEQAFVAKLKNQYRSPYYKIKVSINKKSTNQQVFEFEHKTSNRSEVYNLIPNLQNTINNLIWKKD